MRILAVSGSLRDDSFNTSLLRAAAEAAPDGVEVELWEGLAELPLYDEELDSGDAPGAGAPAARGVGRGGRDPLRDARVQRLGPRRPEERDRLGVAAAARGGAHATRRSPSSARAPASSARCGRSRTSSGSSASPAPASSATEIPVGRAHERFDDEGRLLDGELFEQLRLHLTTLAAEAVPAPERVAATRAKREGPLSRPLDPVTSAYWQRRFLLRLGSQPGGAERVVPYAG